ncbi:MAG: alpha/beta hydrolase [Pseudomonadota bacterium]
MNEPSFLTMPGDRRIAYHKTHATGAGAALPGVVFLGGFKSDMEGTKALALEAWAERTGRAFLRFDYTGHGQSSGAFEDGCIGDWARDAADAVGALTEGPQIVIGSSMGGWISLLLARRMPERIAALIGIAAAPDFTCVMRAEMDEAARLEMAQTGRWSRPSDYSDEPYIITQKLLDEAEDHLILTSSLAAPFPVHLLQGTEDEAVETSVALALLDHVEGPDTRLTLVKGADHRFSEAHELTLLIETVEGIIQPG